MKEGHGCCSGQPSFGAELEPVGSVWKRIEPKFCQKYATTAQNWPPGFLEGGPLQHADQSHPVPPVSRLVNRRTLPAFPLKSFGDLSCITFLHASVIVSGCNPFSTDIARSHLPMCTSEVVSIAANWISSWTAIVSKVTSQCRRRLEVLEMFPSPGGCCRVTQSTPVSANAASHGAQPPREERRRSSTCPTRLGRKRTTCGATHHCEVSDHVI